MDAKFEIIISICCEVCGITQEQFFSTRRLLDIIDARFLAMKVIRVFTKLSHENIGKLLRPYKPLNHTSVMHGVNTIDGYLQSNDEKITALYDEILCKVNKQIFSREKGVLMVFFPKDFNIHSVVREFNLKHHDLEFEIK
jgi:Bacterial dnaA protein helix-turn-helix